MGDEHATQQGDRPRSDAWRRRVPALTCAPAGCGRSRPVPVTPRLGAVVRGHFPPLARGALLRALFTAPLGADFWKLWTSSAVANLGDGVTMVAGPLLVASLTTDPAAVAGAVFAQQLPWLLLALVSGAWADRLDRRRLVVTVNLLRAAALSVLAATVMTGAVRVPVVFAVFFLLGTGETLADTASSAFVPAIVPAEHRPRANALL